MRSLIFLYTAAALALSLQAQVRSIDPPAAEESGMPFLASGAKGEVYLAWTDILPGKKHALRYARWTGSTWTAPETIVSGANWFVNWADFPSLAVLPDGGMLAHWLTRNETGGKYGYGIRIARRDARSGQWREIHGMSLDEPEDYAGFLTFVPNTASAIYLAPPAGQGHGGHGGEHGHRKTVRFLSLTGGGKVASDKELDGDACSCCQTAVAKTESGFVAAYRDHLPGEIRDISVVRYAGGEWSQPKTLHRDGWKINGCPTEGPAMSSSGRNVAIAWLTRAQDSAKIQVALSKDDGASFGAPLRLDGGNAGGRPAIAAYGDGYLAVWLEKTSGTEGQIRARRVGFDGRLYPAFEVAKAPTGRATGFPKVAVTGEQVLVAWRAGKIRAALLTRQDIGQREKEQQ
ncbi:MAG: hypothetical protein JNK48_09640 [Bryobacterales bacterium]|nr:hypothetical protein [Bryobacterales bacterium]